MDALDHLAGPAADLLGRVDDLLAEAGVPAGHPIWPLLGRVRALPGAALDAVVALRPEPLVAAAAALRGLIPAYDDAAAALTVDVAWEGAGAEAFASRRAALSEHLTGGSESLAERLEASAAYLDAVADWVSASRAALARTLAEVLGSAEAVMVVIGPVGPAASASALSRPAAAAQLGARVLATVAELHDRGEALRQQWGGRLVELAFRPPAAAGGRFDGVSRIAL